MRTRIVAGLMGVVLWASLARCAHAQTVSWAFDTVVAGDDPGLFRPYATLSLWDQADPSSPTGWSVGGFFRLTDTPSLLSAPQVFLSLATVPPNAAVVSGEPDTFVAIGQDAYTQVGTVFDLLLIPSDGFAGTFTLSGSGLTAAGLLSPAPGSPLSLVAVMRYQYLAPLFAGGPLARESEAYIGARMGGDGDSVPEPSPLLLMPVGVTCLLAARRRRQCRPSGERRGSGNGTFRDHATRHTHHGGDGGDGSCHGAGC